MWLSQKYQCFGAKLCNSLKKQKKTMFRELWRSGPEAAQPQGLHSSRNIGFVLVFWDSYTVLVQNICIFGRVIGFWRFWLENHAFPNENQWFQSPEEGTQCISFPELRISELRALQLLLFLWARVIWENRDFKLSPFSRQIINWKLCAKCEWLSTQKLHGSQLFPW